MFIPRLLGLLITFPMLSMAIESPKIAIENSAFFHGLITSINGRPITAFEITEKTLSLLQQSEIELSKDERAFKLHWERVLSDTIDLVLLREEARRLFCIRKAKNIENLSEEELQQALIDYLRYSAQMELSPIKIRSAFQDYRKNRSDNKEWQYRVVSLISPLNDEEQIKLEDAIKNKCTAEDLIKCPTLNQKIQVSNLYTSLAKNLHPEYKEILEQVQPGHLSKILSNEQNMFILSLEKEITLDIKSFQEMEPILERAIVHQDLEQKIGTLLLELRKIKECS